MPACRSWLCRGVALAFALAAVGCSAFRSQLVDDDGCSPDLKTKRLKGVPMTLDVPTHVQLTVTEARYANVPSTGETTPFQYDGQLVTTYSVTPTFLTRKQLHTVDFSRPFSGRLMTTLTFNSDKQLITSVKNRVEDNTVTDVTAAVTGLLNKLPALKALAAAAPKSAGPTGNTVVKFTNVVAVEIFDVHDPMLEAKMQAFLDLHLNACAPPCAGQVCR